MKKKNILLCVAGMTPQIITETLYALTQQNGKRIDEIRVITTVEGFDKIMTGIVKGRGSADESLLDPKEGQFYRFLKDYPDVGNIKFERASIDLLESSDKKTFEDIRTLRENELAGDKICEIVAALCADDNKLIFASVAGGRKTMGIYLTAAMQLFGRNEDTLSHVLVNEDFEGGLAPKFFYPPPKPVTLTLRDGRKVSTKNAGIYLAEVPFIRLRGIGAKAFDERTTTYKQAVDKAQKDLRLAESVNELRLDLKNNLVKVADRQVNLSLRQMFVYALFARFRQTNAGDGGFVNLNQISREHLETICRMISKAKGDEVGFEDFETLPKADFVRRLDILGAGKIIRQKKSQRFLKKYGREPKKGEVRVTEDEARKIVVKNLREILGKIEPELRKVFAPEELFEDFYIERRGAKEAYVFGFRIEPERIKFEVEEG